MTLLSELEKVIKSDELMAEARMAGLVSLARIIAAQGDAQLAEDGVLESRLIASYAGLLAQINRSIRDDRVRREKEHGKPLRPASRLAHLKNMTQTTQLGTE